MAPGPRARAIIDFTTICPRPAWVRLISVGSTQPRIRSTVVASGVSPACAINRGEKLCRPCNLQNKLRSVIRSAVLLDIADIFGASHKGVLSGGVELSTQNPLQRAPFYDAWNWDIKPGAPPSLVPSLWSITSGCALLVRSPLSGAIPRPFISSRYLYGRVHDEDSTNLLMAASASPQGQRAGCRDFLATGRIQSGYHRE